MTAWTTRSSSPRWRPLGAPAGKVIKPLLRPTYGYAYVAEADAPAFEALNGKPHGEKALKIERHRPRGSPRRPPPRAPRGDARRAGADPHVGGPGQVGRARRGGRHRRARGLGAPAGKVVRIELRPTYAYVFVADEDAAAFEALNGKQHGEKTLKIERAKRR